MIPEIERAVENGKKALEESRASLQRARELSQEREKEIVESTVRLVEDLRKLGERAEQMLTKADVLIVGEFGIGGPFARCYRNDVRLGVDCYDLIQLLQHMGGNRDLAVIRGPDELVKPGRYRVVVTLEHVEGSDRG